MTIQEALTKASEGGYQPAFKHHEPGMRAVIVGLHGFSIIQVDAIFLDPAFWCVLGRTLGWASRASMERLLAMLYRAPGARQHSRILFCHALSPLRCRLGSSIHPNADPSKHI
jgi:hypothetical protein